ncbi:MAG: PorV/PorQ family protein [bacterium]|nr:PorV/PorQ family protein [bacterium]
MKKIFYSTVLLLFAAQLWALTPGDKSAVFLTLPQGARPTAMGEAYTAVSGDIYGGFWNPAGVADLGPMAFTASMAPTYLDMYYGYLAGGMSFGKNAVALSVTHFNYGDMVGLDQYARNETTFNGTDLGIAATYARRFVKQKMHLGASLKLASQSLEEESATSVMMDLGAIKKFNRFTLGAAVKNLGSGPKFVDESAGLPITFSLGCSYYFYNLPLLPVFSLDVPLDDMPSVGLGAEYNLPKYLSLRAGLKTDRDQGFLSMLRFGLGVNVSGISVDYAMIPGDEIGSTHMITLGYRK